MGMSEKMISNQLQEEFVTLVPSRKCLLFTVLFRAKQPSEEHRNGGFDFPYYGEISKSVYNIETGKFDHETSEQVVCFDLFDDDVMPASSIIPFIAYHLSDRDLTNMSFIFNSQQTKDFIIYALDYIKGTFYLPTSIMERIENGIIINELVSEHSKFTTKQLQLYKLQHKAHLLTHEQFYFLSDLINNYQNKDINLLINKMLYTNNQEEIDLVTDNIKIIIPELTILSYCYEHNAVKSNSDYLL